MEIISAKYIISSPGYKQCPKPDRPEYAFIGRSNVGKSSLINMLTNKKNLAKISSTPGKTQLLNHFELQSADKRSWYIVDLPGYGYATISQKARHNWSNMIESYIRKRENLVCLIVLIDSRHEPQAIDLEFMASQAHRDRLTQIGHAERYTVALDNPFPAVKFNSDRMHQEMLSLIDSLPAYQRLRILSWFLL